MENGNQSIKTINAMKTKNKIYDSAYYLFKQKGFDKVSVDSIVEMAGVAKGSFYVHFDSKNTLISHILAEYVNKMDLDYKSYVESFPEDTAASEILIALSVKTTDVITQDIGYEKMRFIYEILLTKSHSADILLSYGRELYKMFYTIIHKGIQQGEFRTGIPIDTIAKHCIFALRGLTYEWCIRYPDFDLKDAATEHIQMLLTGIK